MFFLVGAFYFSSNKLYAAEKLSKNAQVSLLTISPGEDLYSAFGHSTIWIQDAEKGVDKVYNYGTFDFNQPNFYLNFVKGHLNYSLSVYTFQDQYWSVQQEGRGLVQQILNLDSVQKQKLFDYLEWNSRPENSGYLYDFYLDNCSSRLRDIFLQTCSPGLKFDKSISTPYSFREWMNIFLIPHPWSAFGMNIGLGGPADKKTDYSTQMYLPLNLKLGISGATNYGKPLVSRENELLYPFENQAKINNPVLTFTITIFLLSLLLVFSKERFYLVSAGFDAFLFVSVTLLGLVLALLWLVTDHWVCAWNTDLLWSNPFCVFYLLLFNKRYSHTKFTLYSCIILLILSAGYYTFGYLLPEKPIFTALPLVLALQLRVGYRLFSIFANKTVK